MWAKSTFILWHSLAKASFKFSMDKDGSLLVYPSTSWFIHLSISATDTATLSCDQEGWGKNQNKQRWSISIFLLLLIILMLLSWWIIIEVF